MTNIQEITQCRICKDTDLVDIFDLGDVYPSDFASNGSKFTQKYPLILTECKTCGLVQLRHTVDLDSMYRQYWYKSGLNPTMVKSLRNVVDSALERIFIEEDDLVVDIGCNDGTLLSMFPAGLHKVGFDPATNLKDEARRHCFFINDYFHLPLQESGDLLYKIPDGSYTFLNSSFFLGKAKIVTSIAMFYDLPDPIKFVEDVKSILHPDGLWIIQFQDLISMLKSNAFDNICFEHLEYYSIAVVKSLLERVGLEIFDIEYNPVNGGSLRLYIAFSGKFQVTDNVDKFITREDSYIYSKAYDQFYNRVHEEKTKLLSLIRRIKMSNEHIYVLGASTKGNTLLQYYGLSDEQISGAAEVNEDKFGLRTLGSNIEIIPEDEVLRRKPEYLLVLPWHFSDFFIKKFTPYLLSGGRLIFPLPSVTVFGAENL